MFYVKFRIRNMYPNANLYFVNWSIVPLGVIDPFLPNIPSETRAEAKFVPYLDVCSLPV